MKFGVSHCNIGPYSHPEPLRDLARRAEDAGFESLWTVEHVVLPEVYEPRYPETPDGRFWFDLDLPLTDPLIWMTYAAAVTERVRLGTGILTLPQRNPLITAKEVATLDRLSGGRVDLGIGVGWLREEFDALGVPFDGRGARAEEAVAVLRELWRPGPRSHDGPAYRFDKMHSEPSPDQTPVPIHIGGATRVAARRAGRIAEGFFPGGYDLDVVEPLVALAREEFAAAGREGGLEITARWTKDPAGLADHAPLERLQALGVDRVLVPAQTLAAAGLAETLERLAGSTLPAFA